MIKALEVSSNYKSVRPPKDANWLTDVYVVQRQCLRATTGRPSNPRTPSVPETADTGFAIFEVDFEFKPEPLTTIDF